MELVVKHRFWIACGVVLLLIVGDYVVTASKVAGEAAAKRKAVVDAQAEVKSLTARQDLPNDRWIARATRHADKALADLGAVQKSLFEPQQEVFQWMEPVRKPKRLIPIRPDPISVAQMEKKLRLYKSRYTLEDLRLFLVTFRTEYEDWMDRLERELSPITKDDPSGKMYVSGGALEREDWGRITPELKRVRRVQENMWVQREIVRAIKSVNAKAKNFRKAPIKSLSEIVIGGQEAADSEAEGGAKRSSAQMSVMGPGVDAGMGGGRGASSEGGFDRDTKEARYLFRKRAEYSVLPVKVVLQIEQDKLERFFAAILTSKLNFVVSQVAFAKAAELSIPVAPGTEGGGRSRSRRPSRRRAGAGAEPARDTDAGDAGGTVGTREAGGQDRLAAQLEVTIYFRVYIYKRTKGHDKEQLASLKKTLEEEEKKRQAATGEGGKVKAGKKPGEAGEKPARPAGKPTKAAGGPAKAAEKPAKAAEGPARAAEKPAKAAEGPAKAAEKPAKAAEKPSEAAEKPGEVAGKPAEAAEKPGKAAEKPTKAAGKPAKAVKEPVGEGGRVPPVPKAGASSATRPKAVTSAPTTRPSATAPAKAVAAPPASQPVR